MTSSPTPSTKAPVISDRYRILRRLGSGCMGRVFLARDEAKKQLVALKLMSSERLDPETLVQLQEEFRAISSLRHPQIAAAYDFGYSHERLPYYTREYVEGTPLQPGPPDPRKVSPQEFLAPFFDLLDALYHLHSQGILHLDIHAGNLIVAKEKKRGSVLIDLGFVELLQAGSLSLLRSSGECAPELLSGESPTLASDLYAVGRLLLFRLTGSSGGEPRLPEEIPGWGTRLTLDLERILGKALHPRPEGRFQSAAELGDALSVALGHRAAESRLREPSEFTVGRDRELKLIENTLRAAPSGRTSALCFIGTGGLGKSQLLREARLRGQLRGLEVIEVGFFTPTCEEPVLLNALRTGQRQGKPAAKWLEAMAVEHGGSTAERARRVAEAFFLEEGAPLVILLDDLDHAGRESRILAEAFLVESARRQAENTAGRGLALIATTTKGNFGPPRSAARRSIVRRLKPLGKRDSKALLIALLRPLRAPSSLVHRITQFAEGNPLQLRQVARALRESFGHGEVVPQEVELPRSVLESKRTYPYLTIDKKSDEYGVLSTLAVINRPASAAEIAAAGDLPEGEVRKVLRHFRRRELLRVFKRGEQSRFYFSFPKVDRELAGGLTQPKTRRIHERMAAFLKTKAEEDNPEHLASHLLAAGKLREGRQAALSAAENLRRRGYLERAIRVLSAAAAGEKSAKWRLRFREEISSLYEHAGDHQEGIAVLEPIYHERLGQLKRDESIRIRRRLGVHYHRGGVAQKALKLFLEVKELAKTADDSVELVLVESELAELHIFRGNFKEAERACRRGLDLLSQATPDMEEQFVGRMGAILHGNLGHLELRRMNLEAARRELEAASKLAESFDTPPAQALILNNLGIAYNQLNQFAAAERSFQKAEEFLLRSGKRRGIIQIACNLATIAAKRGSVSGAKREIERATELLSQYPGKRLEFYVNLARGLVAILGGDLLRAIDDLRLAISQASDLGDTQSHLHLSVYLAEAQILAGRYGEGRKTLRRIASATDRVALLALDRMVHSRLFMLESLLNRPKAAEASRQLLNRVQRTKVTFLESWNDLYIAIGHCLNDETETACETLKEVERTFATLQIPAGERCASLALLHLALSSAVSSDLRERLRQISSSGLSHKVLSALDPFVRAEACFLLGDVERANDHVQEAASAIIGLPLLELDWQIEFLRARLAERQGDRKSARRYLYRSLHTRDLLASSLPARLRRGFLSHQRFSALLSFSVRLEKPRPTPLSRLDAGRSLGIVGSSKAIGRILETIDQLRDQEVPVLIQGPMGTGKDLIARALHKASARRQGTFFTLSCPSLPAELFEAELFGYQAGAFTGADESRPGLLEHLAGGTLFLDEVNALSLDCQAKLLRVLDTKMSRRLGGLDAKPVDLRFIAASSADLSSLVASGTFREDLRFRLSVVEIPVPPLRARPEDIPQLVRHFLAEYGRKSGKVLPRFTEEALQVLSTYDWPGNVRQLKTWIQRVLLTSSPGRPLGVNDVRSLLPTSKEGRIFSEELFQGRGLRELTTALEREYLTYLFKEVGGDLQRMVERLGVKEARLYKWFRNVGLDIRELRRR